MAVGWYAPGDAPMLVRFTPPLSGYLWTFPRPDHVGVGICAPLGEVPHPDPRGAPGAGGGAGDARSLGPGGRALRAHHSGSDASDPCSILEAAGEGFALVGDAAALSDPITGEGFFYALRSAALLAETLLAQGSPSRYPERLLEDFGRDLMRAAALHRRFSRPRLRRARGAIRCLEPGRAVRAPRSRALAASATSGSSGGCCGPDRASSSRRVGLTFAAEPDRVSTRCPAWIMSRDLGRPSVDGGRRLGRPGPPRAHGRVSPRARRPRSAGRLSLFLVRRGGRVDDRMMIAAQERRSPTTSSASAGR